MLDIRTDRLTNRLLYLTVLLGVIGTTAHAETTQLGALRQKIIAGAERSLVAPDWMLVGADLAKSFNSPAMIHPVRNEEIKYVQN